MFQFGISFRQKKIKWKYLDIVHIGIWKKPARSIPYTDFLKKKVKHFEINFWQKEGHRKLEP